MKCPPHVANALLTVPQQYIVSLCKDDVTTEVAHFEKQCRYCELPIIILSETLLGIVEKDGWEIKVELPHPS